MAANEKGLCAGWMAMNGTETILDRWLNGKELDAMTFLVTCIKVNKPETANNTLTMAKETIEKWIEDNF